MALAVPFRIITLLFLLTLVLVIPVLVGVYVYRDAKRRGMSAALWTLIAVVTPGLVGLIIYLIVRAGFSGCRCPGCKAPVQSSFNLCPHCGTPLKDRCARCGTPLEPDWMLCPTCGTTLDRPAPEVPEKKDRGIGWILAAVLIAPLCLLLFMAVLAFANYADADASHSITWGRNESAHFFMGSAEVAFWQLECDNQGEGVYALYTVNEDADTRLKTRYVVYVNDDTLWDLRCEVDEGGLFKEAEVKVQLQPLAEGEESTNLFYIATTYEEATELVVRDVNGQELPVQVQKASEPDALSLVNGSGWQNRLAVQVAEDVPEAYEVQVHFYAGALLLGSDGVINADGSPLCRAGDTYYFFAPPDATDYELVFRNETGQEIFRESKSLDAYGAWTIPLVLERAGKENPSLAYAELADE